MDVHHAASNKVFNPAPRFPTNESVARPIIFNAHQVRAIISGGMACTRRLMAQSIANRLDEPRGQADIDAGYPFVETEDGHVSAVKLCPLGCPGTRLWVREGFGAMYDWCDHDEMPGCPSEHWHLGWKYRADGDFDVSTEDGSFTGWKPSIHMPREASRILLEITAIRAERLRDASDMNLLGDLGDMLEDDHTVACREFSRIEHLQSAGAPLRMLAEMYGYKAWWDKTNGAGSFDANPYVWVAEFKVVLVVSPVELEVAQ
jgi:hypothetical protein